MPAPSERPSQAKEHDLRRAHTQAFGGSRRTIAQLDGVGPGDPRHMSVPVLTDKSPEFPSSGSTVAVVGTFLGQPVVVIATSAGTLCTSRPGVVSQPIPLDDVPEAAWLADPYGTEAWRFRDGHAWTGWTSM
jgi:hypothetical protein